jgi:hypothetical protein
MYTLAAHSRLNSRIPRQPIVNTFIVNLKTNWAAIQITANTTIPARPAKKRGLIPITSMANSF